jgi:hypothetical protein
MSTSNERKKEGYTICTVEQALAISSDDESDEGDEGDVRDSNSDDSYDSDNSGPRTRRSAPLPNALVEWRCIGCGDMTSIGNACLCELAAYDAGLDTLNLRH